MCPISLIDNITIGFAATGCSSTPVANTGNQQTGIWVSGNGKITVTPDTANLSLGIQVEASTLTEANEQAAQAMNNVIDAIKEEGVADGDIKTQGFSVYPVYETDKDTNRSYIRGYQVTNTINVKIRDIDNTGKIIDVAAISGGNKLRVHNLYFSIEDLNQVLEEARELALLDAKTKAEQIARVTGVDLGKVSFVSETSSGGGRTETPGAIDKDNATTPIQPGETEVTLTVQVIYSIE